MHNFIWLLIFILISGFAAFAQSDNQNLKELVATEVSFATMAREKSAKAAFVEFIDDDGIVFEPSPVNGKEVWQKRAELPYLLAWQPKYADISSDGVYGYTTGDWQYSAKKNDAPIAFGTYFTIWRKQPSGNWKFVLDLGIDHEKPLTSENGWKAAKGVTKTPKSFSAEKLGDEEKAFSESAKTRGVTKAYNQYLTEDSRLLRNRDFPFVGKKAILAELSKQTTISAWSPLKSFISANFGYTYGAYQNLDATGKTVEKGYYVHVWKWNGKNWRVVLEVVKAAKE